MSTKKGLPFTLYGKTFVLGGRPLGEESHRARIDLLGVTTHGGDAVGLRQATCTALP